MKKRCPEKFSPGKKNPRKNGPLEKWSPGKKILGKIVFRQKNAGKFEQIFYFFHWFHYTHKNMFDFHLTILHAPNCTTLKEFRKVCFRVLGFYRLIRSQDSTHTPRCSTLTPRFFVPEFWVFIDWSPILKLRVHKYRKILIW